MRRSSFLLLMFSAGFLYAADLSTPLTLWSALALAKKQNANVLIAQERVKQSLARESVSRGVLLPQVSAAASQSKQTVNLAARGITIPGRDPIVGPFSSFDARVRLTQTIYDRTAAAQSRVSQANRFATAADSEKSRDDALALVGTLFINAHRAVNSEKLAVILLDRDERRLKLALSRLREGTGSQLDYQRAQAEVDDSRNRLFQTQKQRVERELDLKAALALPMSDVVSFAGETAVTEITLPSDVEITTAVNNHPDVVAAHHKVESQKAQWSAARGGAFPVVGAAADYGASGENMGSSHATYTLGVQMTVPIYQGGQQQARVKETESLLKESEIAEEDVRRREMASALAARQELQQALDLVKARVKDQDVAKKEWGISHHRLKTGTSSRMEEIESSAQAAIAADQLDDATAALFTAQINLAHALGNLNSFIKDNAS